MYCYASLPTLWLRKIFIFSHHTDWRFVHLVCWYLSCPVTLCYHDSAVKKSSFVCHDVAGQFAFTVVSRSEVLWWLNMLILLQIWLCNAASTMCACNCRWCRGQYTWCCCSRCVCTLLLIFICLFLNISRTDNSVIGGLCWLVCGVISQSSSAGYHGG